MKKILLAVGAHPDDIDFGASGTVVKLVQEGWDAYYVICTDGSKGSHDPKMTSEELVQIRKKEQIAAGKVLGLKDVFFLEHSDTELVSDLQFKEELVRIIRTIRPNLVIGLDPTFYFSMEPYFDKEYHFVNHTDHRAAAVATMDAVFPLARDRLTFPLHEIEGLMPHRVEELWIVNWGCKKPDYLVDISETLKKKLAALKEHTSQFDDYEEIAERVTERAKAHAEKAEFEFAESFIRLKMS
jgi:LmbE family N-acetylglucosaminyl deacetylase